jgi:hypothetical protein
MSKLTPYYRLTRKQDANGTWWVRAMPQFPYCKVLDIVSTEYRQETIKAAEILVIMNRHRLHQIREERKKEIKEPVIF